MISHDGKDCEVWLAKENLEKTEPHEYGPWLKALPYNPRKTPFIMVPSMGDGLGGIPRSAQLSNNAKWRSNPPGKAMPDLILVRRTALI